MLRADYHTQAQRSISSCAVFFVFFCRFFFCFQNRRGGRDKDADSRSSSRRDGDRRDRDDKDRDRDRKRDRWVGSR